jgi:hypothetical protein
MACRGLAFSLGQPLTPTVDNISINSIFKKPAFLTVSHKDGYV